MIVQPAAGPGQTGQPAATPGPHPGPGATVVPDWGNQVSLFQTRQPAFWLYVAVLAICAILLANQEFTYLQYSPIASVIGAILLAIFAVPLVILIGALDLFEREPLSLMAGAFLWGAVAVFPLALATNDSFLQLWVKLFGSGIGLGWLAAIVGPPVEETLKFIGIVIVFLIARSEFDDVLDGFVYGALVGLGFQITEDMFYFFQHFIGPAQGVNEIGALIEGYWIRVISSGLYSHPLYAGISGMGLAYWATRLDQPLQRRRLFLVGGLVVAMLLHAFWNAPLLNDLLGNDPGPLNWLLFSTVKGIPLLIFIGLMIRLATRREQGYFEAVMGPELGTDVVTADEMRGLSDLRARFTTRRAMRAQKGPVAGKLFARVQREQIRYAMLATETVDNRDTLLAAQRELIRTLRAQLLAMPDVPKPVVVAPIQVAAQPQVYAPAQPQVAAQPQVVYAAPAAPFVPAGPIGWSPTHRAAAPGQQSWDQPDPSRPMTPLAGNLDLQVVQRVGDWAKVVASNGWTGWVDARLLTPR